MSSWLFGEKAKESQSGTSAFGVVSSSKFKDSIKFNEIEQKFSKTDEKIKKEMTKYKQIALLNKKLTDSYVANYYTMIDISKLLKDYSDVFDKLSVILQKYDQIEISPVDMAHLKNITRSKLDEITGDFNKQSSSIRSLYTKFNMGPELGKLSSVEPLSKDLGTTVDDTINKLSIAGGKKQNHLKKCSNKLINNGRTNQKKTGKKAQSC